MYDHKIRLELKKQFFSKVKAEGLLFDEVGFMQGKTICDLVVITPDTIQGFEIKSGADTLQRLPKQVVDYDLVCDFNTVITESGHLAKVLKIVPSWWGIILADEAMDTIVFTNYRLPHSHITIDKRSIIELLWKDEINLILNRNDIKRSNTLKKEKLYDLCCANLTLQQIKSYIYEYLAKRDWKKQDEDMGGSRN